MAILNITTMAEDKSKKVDELQDEQLDEVNGARNLPKGLVDFTKKVIVAGGVGNLVNDKS